MQLKPLLAAFIVAAAGPLHAITYPIKDATAAISIAKKVCANKVSPTAKWHAMLDKGGRVAHWFVTTPNIAPSIRAARTPYERHIGGRGQGYGSAVWVAVDKPRTSTCIVNVFYDYSDAPRERGRWSPPAASVMVPSPKPSPLVRKRGA